MNLTKVIINRTMEWRFSWLIKYVQSSMEWQKRKKWEEMYLHSYRMFKDCLACEIYDDNILKACLLHDIVEDGKILLIDIKRNFGSGLACMVDWLTCTSENKEKMKKREYFSKFQESVNKDWRIAFVKLLDCIDNIKTLDWLKPNRQVKFLREKKEFYLPVLKKTFYMVPEDYLEVYTDKLFEFVELLDAYN